MSDLQSFVLDLCEANGALIDPPSYGAYEVPLPDDLAAKLDVPALEEIAFDEGEPTAGDGRLHLAQGHPLVDRMVELARRGPGLTQAHINAVRLDKRGLAELARQTLPFANARLVELRGQAEAAALYHHLLLTFKVTLTTDEKQEHLATVAMHAQAGWPMDWGTIQKQVALDEAPAFAHLAPAQPAWLDEPDPFTPRRWQGPMRGRSAPRWPRWPDPSRA